MKKSILCYCHMTRSCWINEVCSKLSPFQERLKYSSALFSDRKLKRQNGEDKRGEHVVMVSRLKKMKGIVWINNWP